MKIREKGGDGGLKCSENKKSVIKQRKDEHHKTKRYSTDGKEVPTSAQLRRKKNTVEKVFQLYCRKFFFSFNSLPPRIFSVFLSSGDFFQKILSGMPSECQIVWVQIRPDISSGLIWVQTVCKSYQQTTQEDHELIRDRIKHLIIKC